MSYDADLLNAYRDQLAKIRAAWQIFKNDDFTDCGVYSGFLNTAMENVDTAISSTEADDIEALYRPIPDLIVVDEASSTDLVEGFRKWAESPEGKAWYASPLRLQFVSTEPSCTCAICRQEGK